MYSQSSHLNSFREEPKPCLVYQFLFLLYSKVSAEFSLWQRMLRRYSVANASVINVVEHLYVFPLYCSQGQVLECRCFGQQVCVEQVPFALLRQPIAK